jgi:molybdopterin-guanine dinucleotide biosynthesis protein MobB
MLKVIAVVGCKKSGKTSLIGQLVETLTERGYRVGVIKNTHHSVSFDEPGTDTHRFREAGARRVMLTSPDGAVMTHFSTDNNDKPQYLAELSMNDLDLVLLEGFKQSPLKKILVHGSEENIQFNRRGLVATVGRGSSMEGLPDFEPDDAPGLAAFLERCFLHPDRRESMDIEIKVDGSKIGLKGFVKDILSSTIMGMVSTLKGCKDPEKIEITVNLKQENQGADD